MLKKLKLLALDVLLKLIRSIPQFLIFLLGSFKHSPKPLYFLREEGQLLLILFVSFLYFLFLFIHDQETIFHIDELDLIVAFGFLIYCGKVFICPWGEIYFWFDDMK